jgi:hypothetical protein
MRITPTRTKRTPMPLAKHYAEFAEFYKDHRCDGSPEDPRRTFNFAVKTLYLPNKHRLHEWDFMSCLCRALWSLFRWFDTAKYHGRDVEKHFLSLLKKHALSQMSRIRPWSNQGPACKRCRSGTPCSPKGTCEERQQDALTGFESLPALAIFRGTKTREGRLESEAESSWEVELRETVERAKFRLPKAIDSLTIPELVAIFLIYDCGCGYRETGRRLGIDHKAVGRLHERTIRKLREFFPEAA